ncbi:L-fucose:H+ symporter permease [Secundilactobacillus kimchicus]|uniref:Transporter, major facilitator family protein n=1 Tax=Secundilactobacillus kimchicus JCM 15530 TaxID=1302272 RepID=A0A0R1HZ29_9LACO|nr:L-fucose:H+ symporter permease [Secundilactobacillus kimchicus]KRK48714.1 transporter, major facilitator family protein [Secundilactobacillus kimchicus JCM 15530]MBT9672067.1 L-fucose:H+ symporter permease [Secundilactobacillus kimchicus]
MQQTAEKKHGWVQLSDGYLSKTPIFQFLMVSLIFPLWGAAASLNDILITQFKTVFMLNDAATAFVQSAFYGGYFLIAIPASLVIKKASYKFAIMTGLIFYIIGCAIFFPASRVATYSMFLVAIFAIAIGLSFLETSCDTYSSMLGPKKYATLRLNFSQTLVPLGDITGILLGKYLIFGSVGNLAEKMSHMHGAERIAYGEQMLQLTLRPYKYILIVLIAMLIIFALVPMPRAKATATNADGSVAEEERPSLGETIKYLWHNTGFKKGVFTQFIYAGLQTTVWSFTIRLALNLNHSITDSAASTFMIYSYIAWFVGKLVANFFMARFSITGTLTGFSLLGVVALVITFTVPNMTAVYAAIATSFFFGPEWPTIYTHTLDHIQEKKYTETGGAIIVMALIGGAIIPAIQGLVSDLTGSMQLSFVVPALCYLYITLYFFSEYRFEKKHPETMQEH